MAAKERITRFACSRRQGRLHAICSDSPGISEAAADVLQRACHNPALRRWLSSDRDGATMKTPAMQTIFHLLYALSVEVSRVMGVHMPSSVDPQHPYGQAEAEACLSQVLTDKQELSWRARDLWSRDADETGFASREATSLVQHLWRLDPDQSPATMDDLREALDRQLQQLEHKVEELMGVIRCNRRRSIKDY